MFIRVIKSTLIIVTVITSMAIFVNHSIAQVNDKNSPKIMQESNKENIHEEVTKEELYKTIIDLKDERIQLVQGNISSVLNIMGVMLSFFALIAAILALTIGRINKKIGEVDKLIKRSNALSKEIEESLANAKKLEEIYSKFGDYQESLKSAGNYITDDQFTTLQPDVVNNVENDEDRNFAVSTKQKFIEVIRGEVFLADLSSIGGLDQGGLRPVIIVQNDIGNKYSPTATVVPVTSKLKRAKLPTHVEITINNQKCVALAEQIRTIEKWRLKKLITELDRESLKRIENALSVQIGLVTNETF